MDSVVVRCRYPEIVETKPTYCELENQPWVKCSGPAKGTDVAASDDSSQAENGTSESTGVVMNEKLMSVGLRGKWKRAAL